MKMTKTTFDELTKVITAKDCEEYRQAYREGRFPRAEGTKDLNMRYRWDLYYAVRGHDITKGQDLNNEHIDTALRKIVSAL